MNKDELELLESELQAFESKFIELDIKNRLNLAFDNINTWEGSKINHVRNSFEDSYEFELCNSVIDDKIQSHKTEVDRLMEDLNYFNENITYLKAKIKVLSV